MSASAHNLAPADDAAEKPRQRPTPIAPLLTYEEAAHVLKISVITLRRWVSEARIPHIRLGKHLVRFRADVVDKWLERQSQRAIG